MTYGMNFAPHDAVNNPSYTTTQSRLQIDLNNPAPLFNVVTQSAGTAWNVSTANPFNISEQLLVVNHQLGYVPQVYVAFLLLPISGASSGATYTGQYSMGQLLIYEAALVNEYINYSVNTTTLTINHVLTGGGFDVGPYTSPANQYLIQVKYLICNNPVVQTITIN